MANGRNDWRSGPEAAQLRREFREEAIKLREDMRDEFQRKFAEQMAMMQAQQPGPQRGHHRGRRASLSKDAIVETAMKIMRTKGLDKVTMRSIAHELNTGPASIYVHVRSVVQLHGFMLDALYATLDLDGGDGDWATRIKRLIGDAMAVLLQHPELARSAIAARPIGDGSLRFADRMLELLAEGGVAPARAAWGVDLLLLYATSLAAELASDEADDNATLMVFRSQLATGAYPHISAVEDTLFEGSDADRANWAIDAILAGLTRTPVPGFD